MVAIVISMEKNQNKTPKSMTALTRILSDIGGRISDRKQTDLRFTHDLSKSLLSVVRAYQDAKKKRFSRTSIDKIDAAIKKILI